ncbi:hypothetical protein DR864_27285 [Runella rosea]|uniref:Uncharacterized protein n=1 Tax=Runella rosea TaxID=2259595 RepID=A0A344TRA6_9BACT|nr:hypothetical protein [Runella rosea]AXE21177.1 hypothetical protein DR864_27285 [Runella rosea]
MTLTELKAWIAANVFTSNNRLNSATSLRELLYKVSEETYNKVDETFGLDFLKSPKKTFSTPKGLEMWGTNGAVFGLTNDYLEASVKTVNVGGAAPEMEFWDVFANTKFSFRDGVARTERFQIMGGNAWLPANLHIGVGTDRTNYGSALFVNGHIRQGNTLGNKKISLWVDAENDHQFYGFGLNSAVMRYQVATLGADHIFYAGNGALSSNELMRIRGNGNVIVGGSDIGMGKFQVMGAMYSSLGVTSDEMFYLRKNGSTTISNTFYQQNISGGTTYAMNMQMTPTGGIAFWNFIGGVGWANRMTIKDTGAVRFVPLSAAPSSPENGDTYYDSTLGKLRVYAAGAWANLH